MNFRLGLGTILILSEFLASFVFYTLNPFGPVCSPYASKWSYINDHFIVFILMWGLVWMVTAFFADPMFWQMTQRWAFMIKPLIFCGIIGLVIDIGASTYQRWVIPTDTTLHTWTRWGLIVNASERTLLWLVLYAGLATAFILWTRRREADTIEF